MTEAISQGAEVCLVWRLALCSAIKPLSRHWGGKTRVGTEGFFLILHGMWMHQGVPCNFLWPQFFSPLTWLRCFCDGRSLGPLLQVTLYCSKFSIQPKSRDRRYKMPFSSKFRSHFHSGMTRESYRERVGLSSITPNPSWYKRQFMERQRVLLGRAISPHSLL